MEQNKQISKLQNAIFSLPVTDKKSFGRYCLLLFHLLNNLNFDFDFDSVAVDYSFDSFVVIHNSYNWHTVKLVLDTNTADKHSNSHMAAVIATVTVVDHNTHNCNYNYY